MNKRMRLALCAVIAVGVAVPVAARVRESARLEAARMSAAPQDQRPLRVPSEKSLDSIFPGDARRILEQSENLTLLSVSPSPGDYDDPANAPSRPKFHEHGILGQTRVAGSVKAELLASFYDGFIAPYSPPRADGLKNLKQIGFGCFNPRHGIRATSGGKTIDLLICFECRHFEVYENGKLVRQRSLATDAPLPVFNRILTKAHVPLSPT